MVDLKQIKESFGLWGNDPAWEEALFTAVKLAPSDLPILIYGETGVGKDIIPQVIHKYSLRKNNKYLALNCGGIPESTIDAELFGHEKGAFTGAYEARKGYFEEADGGTLFLDEIAELPLSTQAKLLRVLQNGEYMRMGSSQVRKTNVRIIAATNVNLFTAVAHHKFREDLFYRINSISITIPSLRERKGDIVLLFRGFAFYQADKYGIDMFKISPEAEKFLKDYRWPGNIRQLKSVAEALAALKAGGILTVDDIKAILPKEDATLPVVFGEGGKEGIKPEEKEAIFMMLRRLHDEVEHLKRIVAAQSGNDAGVVLAQPISPQPQEADDEDWQESYDDPQDAPQSAAPQAPQAAAPQATQPDCLDLKKLTDENIRKALERHGGNRKAAAAELGISDRTLYRKLKK